MGISPLFSSSQYFVPFDKAGINNTIKPTKEHPDFYAIDWFIQIISYNIDAKGTKYYEDENSRKIPTSMGKRNRISFPSRNFMFYVYTRAPCGLG
jgi:hypothetical protein